MARTEGQKGIVLATEVFKSAKALPYRDHQGIGLQPQRAAVSIPSDVAEGWARGLGRSYPFHLRVAPGSEAELQTDLEICIRAGVLSEPVGESLLMQTSELGRMLHGLLNAVESKRRGTSRSQLT
jgi:four helix bundle protein